MKIKFLASITIAALLLVSACEDDPTDGGDLPPEYQDLSQKAHVLQNLELAYTNRAISEYTKLLDADFTMFFSAGDFGSGGTPEQWGRSEEVSANTNLFNPNYVDQDPSNGTYPAVTNILLNVKWEDGLTWQEIDSPNTPGEKWYTATIFYDFQFDMGPGFHLINNPGSKAQFTVRNTVAATDQAPHWQLVEMRDLDGSVAARNVSSSTEQSTWGQVKALYASTPPADDDLTTREAVLENLEASYNLRQIDKYTEVLDANFTMFFAPGDVSGGVTPEQWGRSDEVSANTNLLNPNYVDQDPSDGIQPRCVGITLDVKWEDGVTWQQIIPASAPTETWYVTTLLHDFQFDIEGDLHLISNPGSISQFTVRNAGTVQAPRWQLVEMRDLGSEVAARGASSWTKQSTWGSVKALYLP